ncbi:hypothetical protein N7451_008474 [Penicillium sp. IBT 35674x]|nr:hypothetical protein N7451_008474 [Penicillium sp. IBT 35674x]
MGRKVLKNLTSPIRSMRERHRERREAREAAPGPGRRGTRGRREATAAAPQIEEAIPDPNLGLDDNTVEQMLEAVKIRAKTVKRPEDKIPTTVVAKDTEGDSRSGSGALKKRRSRDSESRTMRSEAGVKKSSSGKSTKSNRGPSGNASEESAAVRKGKKPAKKASTASIASTVSSRLSIEGARVAGYFEGKYIQSGGVTARHRATAPAATEPSALEPVVPPAAPAQGSRLGRISSGDWEEKDASKPRESLRERGIQMARWIEDPKAPGCPISESKMTSKEILEHTEGIKLNNPDYKTLGQTEITMYLPPPEVLPRAHGDYRRAIIDSLNFMCYTVMSKYVIVLENIWRDPMGRANYPYISDAVICMHRELYGTNEMLRYIIASVVVNPQTQSYVKNLLYPGGWHTIPQYEGGEKEGNSKAKPDYFARGTPQFQELLGTRIGRTVGAILLSGFPRGTRRITGIHVWVCAGGLQFRFDIRSN